MKRVVVHKPGGYHRLQIEDFRLPQIGPTDVHIAVDAIGVNFADCIVRMGLYRSAREYVGWPITPGFEVAGTVARVGDAVDDLEVGQPVMAVTRFGGYATDVVVRRRQVFPIPQPMTMAQAAAFPTTHLTAWYALCELARLHAGDCVLIHSAAGGVGGALVQLARHFRCNVVAVVGAPHKVEVAQRHGAHVVIDASQGNLWGEAAAAVPAGFQAVFDANGVATLRQSYAHLRPTGRLIVYGFATMLPRGTGVPRWWSLLWHWLRTPWFNPLRMTEQNRSVMAFNLSYLFDRHDVLQPAMATLLQWAQGDVLKPPPIQTFAFEDVAQAHHALESGQTVGKLVLSVTRS